MKVLLVEDSPGDARLVEEMLIETGAEFEIAHVERLSEAVQRLGEERFDVVLLDLSLPDSQGLETFVKVHGQASEVPIVVLTGLDDETIAVKAVQEGAQDYLVKGQAKGHLLVRSMRYAIERHKTRVKGGVVIIGADASTEQELRRLLGTVTPVLGDASDYQSGYELVKTTAPDIIFVDLSQDPDQALELIEKLAAERPELKIFVIGKEKTPDLVFKATRLGARDFFVLPNDEAVIHRTVVSLSTEYVDKAPRGKILSVFSLQGGCGTTTLATNLAAFFAQSPEKKSVLFDLDLYKKDVPCFLNLEIPFTITEFLQNLDRLDGELLNSSLAKHASGLFVLGHPKSYEEIEDITGENVTRVLQTLRQHFDFVVVDCIKAINDVFIAVMDATDTIILVTLQTVPALKNTKGCLELFERLGYDKNKVKIVLNRFKKKERDFSLKKIEETLGWPITATLTNLGQKATEVMNVGRLLQEAQPKTKLTQEIAALGGSLAAGAMPKVAQRSGLFGFLKKGG